MGSKCCMGFSPVCLSHSLRALLAGPDQHRAQPCQGWPSSAIHEALDAASTVLRSQGQQRTTSEGGSTESGGARARLIGPLFLLSIIAIKQPAERQARKASLRGGHFNIVQIIRPR